MKDKIKNARKLLIVVDMIEGFMSDGKGILADGKTMRIVPEVTKIIEHFIAENEPIITLRDVHNEDSPEHDVFASLPEKHCLEDTEETLLIEALRVYETLMLDIAKNATMGLTAPIHELEGAYANLIELFNAMKKLEELVFVGVCTDICVMNNAIPAKNHFNQINRRVKVTVPRNGVDTYHIPETHEKDEWNEMAFRFMNQAGVETPSEYEMKKGR